MTIPRLDGAISSSTRAPCTERCFGRYPFFFLSFDPRLVSVVDVAHSDLCIRSKKVFAHEHALYPPNVLPSHLPSIPHRSNKQPLKEPIEGGTHPLCAFCRECFFDDDELFVHMRERHEECFICKRNEVRDQ